jgi:SAM-dependent methyltransferase
VKSLLDRIRISGLEDIDVDGAERLLAHEKILASKPMLQKVFSDFHHLFRRLDERHLTGAGQRIELGAGVAAIRNSYPDVLATDIVPSDQLDRTLNAQDMDLGDGSVRAIYGQNCFHHFPQPELFFDELERVLAPGGGAILLEPYYGPIASWMFPRLFATEGFDKTFPSWETPATGPMNGANQALSYIVFVRDRARFESKYPKLEIVHQEVCGNHLEYLLSGGLNFRQLVPNWMIPVVSITQKIASPLNRWTSLHHVVVIRKRAE